VFLQILFKTIYIESTVVIFLGNKTDLAICVVNVFDDFCVEKILRMKIFDVFFIFRGLLIWLLFIFVEILFYIYQQLRNGIGLVIPIHVTKNMHLFQVHLVFSPSFSKKKSKFLFHIFEPVIPIFKIHTVELDYTIKDSPMQCSYWVLTFSGNCIQ